MKYFICTFLLFICAFTYASCQTKQEAHQMTWDEFVAVMLEDADEETIDEETMERLYELHINPLNLNIATKADMDELPFLAEEQIEDILHYVKRNGQMISLGELMMIKSLTQE